MIYQSFTVFITVILYFILLIYMNSVMICGLPVALIIGTCHLILITYVSFFSKSISFIEKFSYNTWYKMTFGTILWILYFIIGGIILFIIDVVLSILLSIIIIVLCLVCQSILWPFIDSGKTYKILNKIINGYDNGIKNVCQQSIRRDKSIYNTDLKNLIKNDKNEMVKNNNNNSNSNNILKTAEITRNEKSVQDFRNNFNFNNLVKITIFTLVIEDFINETKLVLPINYLEKRILLKTLWHTWLHCLNSSIILCGRWWRILCLHTLGIYSIINSHIIEYNYIYEGYRFFWWHKKSIIEEPHFC